MLELAALPGAAILSAVNSSYGLPVTDLAFLPIGNDVAAWVYRLKSAGGDGYFLKVRRGLKNEASLAVFRPCPILG
jgi:hypothetical protein